ncbi:MAG: crossover junction endodeoxyribonuclease RuvC [Pseudomonadota bacterium]
MLIMGLDPGLRTTGWGLIEANHNHIAMRKSGTIKIDHRGNLASRLCQLFYALEQIIQTHSPDVCSVEDMFVSHNGQTTLKLGHARSVILLVPSLKNLDIYEYAPTLVKKSVTGSGRADKRQIQRMINILLPNANPDSEHAADALAVAICHAQHERKHTSSMQKITNK